MSSNSAAAEAERVLRICSACMYCDGFCPVFPALAGKHQFALADLSYLANLCHNCRGCYYACQYAPPHPFAVNVPVSLAAVRRQSYAKYVWPRALGLAFHRPFYGAAIAAIVTLAIVLLMGAAEETRNSWFVAHAGTGAFYSVVPWELMAGMAAASFFWAIVSLTVSTLRFWRVIAPDVPRIVLRRALTSTLWDILTLRHLRGGGFGCNDTDILLSQKRRVFHHVMAAGVLLDFVATAAAAFEQYALGAVPPYAYSSFPICAGVGGGAAILVGASGLLALEVRADRAPSERKEAALNAIFLMILMTVATSGLALLAFRETLAMSVLLVFHVSVVVGLFAALPATKMLHAPYRAVALWRFVSERLWRMSPLKHPDTTPDSE